MVLELSALFASKDDDLEKSSARSYYRATVKVAQVPVVLMALEDMKANHVLPVKRCVRHPYKIQEC